MVRSSTEGLVYKFICEHTLVWKYSSIISAKKCNKMHHLQIHMTTHLLSQVEATQGVYILFCLLSDWTAIEGV